MWHAELQRDPAGNGHPIRCFGLRSGPHLLVAARGRRPTVRGDGGVPVGESGAGDRGRDRVVPVAGWSRRDRRARGGRGFDDRGRSGGARPDLCLAPGSLRDARRPVRRDEGGLAIGVGRGGSGAGRGRRAGRVRSGAVGAIRRRLAGKEGGMTPGLPMFRRISAEDRGLIRRMTEPFAPYSEVQPTAMLAWDTNGDGELAIVNGNLAFKLPHYDGDGYFVTFVGTRQVVKTVRQLLRFAQSQPDVEPRLRRIPEVAVRHSAGLRSRFAVTPAPEDFDYVFAIADLATLAGADYEEKRRAIRRLLDEIAAE